jgi:hypothetical protein
MSMKKLIFILFVQISLLSCSLSKTELIGSYSWNNGQKGQLTIYSDLTYSYNFDIDMTDSLMNIGTWEFDSINREISFHDFKFSRNDHIKGTWISRVQKKKDDIHLMYASDSDIYLKKNK